MTSMMLEIVFAEVVMRMLAMTTKLSQVSETHTHIEREKRREREIDR